MGWKFRKSIKILPGFKLNLSKSGISSTIGGKGLSVNVGRKGTFLNKSIPGTGLYDRQKISSNNPQNKILVGFFIGVGFFVLLVAFLLLYVGTA